MAKDDGGYAKELEDILKKLNTARSMSEEELARHGKRINALLDTASHDVHNKLSTMIDRNQAAIWRLDELRTPNDIAARHFLSNDVFEKAGISARTPESTPPASTSRRPSKS